MLNLIQEELVERGVNRQQFISLNFENMSNAHLCNAVTPHDEIIRRAANLEGKVYFFFDEIQEVAGWEKCINSFRVELDCDIYITGSNAKLLSGELATYLAGRYVEFVIYPFSFVEFVELYHTVYPDTDTRQCFQEYLLLGGMPYLSNIHYEEEPCRQYLQDLFNSVELKDINLVLENIVYMELLRRGYTVTVGKVSNQEVDFVAQIRNSKLYVQVAYLLASEDTIRREFGAFDRVKDNFPKYVVTLDEFDMSRDGIKHRNIRDFLLAEEWN